MRFLLFDRVTHLEPGKRIEGTKCVSLTEECFRGHFPRAPRMPATLVVEAMVQLLGRLVMATHDHRVGVFLTIVEDVTVPADLAPGCVLRLVGELQSTSPRGSVGRAFAEVDGERVASLGRVVYGQFPHPDPLALERRLDRQYGPLPEAAP